MTFDEYQLAAQTGHPKDAKDEIYHLVLGMMGEAGEIAEKFKKLIRDKQSDFTQLDQADLKKELGDVLWYVAILARYFDISFEDVARTNIAKLAGRQARNVIKGSGDNR